MKNGFKLNFYLTQKAKKNMLMPNCCYTHDHKTTLSETVITQSIKSFIL